MLFKNIGVSNFKSFRHLDANLGPFNVVIGANASGKSNFVQVFHFIRDMAVLGIEETISKHGGMERVLNFHLRDTENLSIWFSLLLDHRIADSGGKNFMIRELDYSFSMRPVRKGTSCELEEEHLRCRLSVFDPASGEQEGTIVIKRGDGRIETDIDFPRPFHLQVGEHFEPIFGLSKWLTPNILLLQLPFFMAAFGWKHDFISVYNIQPAEAKGWVSEGNGAKLEENGRNLAAVLNAIMSDRERAEHLRHLVSYILPFVKGIDIERGFFTRFNLQEAYGEPYIVPSQCTSDGTVRIIAMLVALFMDEQPFCIIEEPERSIHPSLLSRLVELMRDASKRRQLIVTTHSPEFVKHVAVEDLLLIERDREGFSTIKRPADMLAVKVFLENQIGLDELYIRGLLGA